MAKKRLCIMCDLKRTVNDRPLLYHLVCFGYLLKVIFAVKKVRNLIVFK